MAEKALRARKKAGLTAMPLMARVAIRPVDDLAARSARNTLLAVPHPVLVRKEARANHGARKLRREKPTNLPKNTFMG